MAMVIGFTKSERDGRIIGFTKQRKAVFPTKEIEPGTYECEVVSDREKHMLVKPLYLINYPIQKGEYEIFENQCSCRLCKGFQFNPKQVPAGFKYEELGGRCPQILVYDPDKYITTWVSSNGNETLGVTGATGAKKVKPTIEPVDVFGATVHGCYKCGMLQKVKLYLKSEWDKQYEQ